MDMGGGMDGMMAGWTNSWQDREIDGYRDKQTDRQKIETLRDRDTQNEIDKDIDTQRYRSTDRLIDR